MKAPNNSFLPCQIDYILDNSPILVCEKSRQIGLTWASGYKVMRRIWSSELKQDHFWVSRDEFTAKLFLQDVIMWIQVFNTVSNHKKEFKKDIVDWKGVQAMKITFDCGSRLYVLSSSVNAVVGKRGHFYIDEAAIHKDFEQLYDYVAPCANWGYTLTIFSTHRSKQTFFYKLCDRIRKGEIVGGRLMTITLEHVLDQGYIDKINTKKLMLNGKTYDKPEDFFNEKKQNASSEAMFLQEYMAIPADAEAVQAVTETDLRRIMRPYEQIRATRRTGGRYYAGIDIGRNRDLTVFWVVEDVSTSSQPLLITRCVEIIRREKYALQEKQLSEWLKYWRPRKCLIDGTNVGENIAENLEDRFSSCEKVKITKATRPVWISNLIGFTRRQNTCLHIPDSNEVWEDFLSVERYINKEGKEDFFIPSHRERGHGDRFMALVLCLQAFLCKKSLAKYTLENEQVIKPEIKSQKELRRENHKRRRPRISF